MKQRRNERMNDIGVWSSKGSNGYGKFNVKFQIECHIHSDVIHIFRVSNTINMSLL